MASPPSSSSSTSSSSSSRNAITSKSSPSCSRVSRKFRLLIPLLLFLSLFLHSLFDLSSFHPFLIFPDNNNGDALAIHEGKNISSSVSSRMDTAIDPQQHRFAYAFLIAGCDPKDGTYRGFLYSVLLAIHTLFTSGSRADYIVMIQMAASNPDINNSNTLPDMDLEPFIKLNQTIVATTSINHNPYHHHQQQAIYFRYLPTPTADNFYQAMMFKFVILNWTEYSRVLYLDADVLPYCNLDYWFDLSQAGILKPNVILAAGSSPINGGTFLIQPGGIQDYARLQHILDRQQQHALIWASQKKRRVFDEINGWGHAIGPSSSSSTNTTTTTTTTNTTTTTADYWMNIKKAKGTLWNFHAAFADQGLLYHWVKYVKKNVSIIIYDIVEHWTSLSSSSSSSSNASTSDSDDPPVLESNVSALNVPGLGCGGSWRLRRGIPRNPYGDFWHHMGDIKPWELPVVPNDVASPEQTGDARQIWFHYFRKVFRALNMTTTHDDGGNLNLTNTFPLGAPALGRNPYRDQMLSTARARGVGSKNISE